MSIAAKRDRACLKLLADTHAIAAKEGITPSGLHAIKLKLVALSRKADLFPLSDFEMPQAQGRIHPLLEEENDGFGLYLAINKPGREAAPHDHGVWCVNAALSGRERHEFFRRADRVTAKGPEVVEKVGEVVVEPGIGMAMADHAIHGNKVIGRELAVQLMLYGYAIRRFPSVVWYHPAFGTTRASPSRRPSAAA